MQFVAFLTLVAGLTPPLSQTLLDRMPQDLGVTRLVIPDADPAFRALEDAWNRKDADAFRAELEALEVSGKIIPEFGLHYLQPRPYSRLSANGGPIPISDSTDIREVELVVDPSTGNMLAFLTSDTSPQVITLMSSDGGNTWVQTFNWTGSFPYKIDAFLANVSGTTYVYLADIYGPHQARVRRFSMNTGVYDVTWGNNPVFTATDTLKELSAFTSPAFVLGYFLYLHTDGTVDYYFASLDSPSFSSFATGVTNAGQGLSGTYVNGQIGPVIFAYTNDTQDTLFVRWRTGATAFGGTFFTGSSFNGVRQTAVAAQADTVIVVYDYYNPDSAAYYVRYRIMYGDTSLFLSGIIAATGPSQGFPRAIQHDGTFAISWIHHGTEPDSIIYVTRPVGTANWSSTWSFPYDYRTHAPDHDLAPMGGGVYGFLAVDGGLGDQAVFMASTWTDVAEPVESTPVAGVRLDRSMVRRGGKLSLTFPARERVRIILLSVDGRRQRVVFEGEAQTTLALRAPARAGIYFLQVQYPRRTETRRFVVIP